MHKVGIACSAFDLLHAGHMLMLKDCKEYCNYLIAGLQVDPSVTDISYRGKIKNPPVMSLKERLIILEGVKYIDEIFIYTTEEDLHQRLKEIFHHVRILGSDWEGKYATGQEFAKKIVYHERKHNYSTTELRERVWEAENYRRDTYN